ncbi:MAG: ABC transporter permease, partial [Gammaproteobacteria bacterium]|nr:ABC transporter permease [Gammaproteobacteria bacterium]
MTDATHKESVKIRAIGFAVDKARVGEFERFVRSILRNPGAVFGLAIFFVIVVLTIAAPLIAPHDPLKMGVGPKLTPPSTEYWFGTDEFGRDFFSRMVFGTRLTMLIGIGAISIALTIGVVVGLTAGYFGGLFESLAMRGMDVLFSFTDTLIALVAVAVLGPSLKNAIIAVGIAQIAFYARVAHSAVIVEINKEYFIASSAVGSGHLRMIFLHLLPNTASPIIIMATIGIATAILNAAGLSFLGLGAQPPSSEWGGMLAAGRVYITLAPWLVVIPGVAISLVVLAFN